MSLANNAENNVLDAMLGTGQVIGLFSAVWLGVSSTDPGETGAGSTEPSTGSYARVSVPALTWAAASGGQKTTSSPLSFPEATAQWLSGVPVAYWFLANSATIGNTSSILLSGALAAGKVIDTGDTLRFNAGAIVISLD